MVGGRAGKHSRARSKTVDWCQVEMGEERGAEIHALFEQLLGGACPCYSEGRCPLAPAAEREAEAPPFASGF